jgi:hypothetical protein
LASKVRIIIRTSLIESSDVAVSSTSFAVGFGIVCIEIVAAGEASIAARHPAYMRLLLRVTLHMALQVLLSLKLSLAAGLFAPKLYLLDYGRKVLQPETLL